MGMNGYRGRLCRRDGHISMQTLKLKDNHTWKCRPGWCICVLDRGLVRFDYPAHWILEPDEDSGTIHLHDRKPSLESCDLGVSIYRIPMKAIQAMRMEELLLQSLQERVGTCQQSAVERVPREDIELIWVEQRYIDKDHNRDARFRVALARGETLCLISMNYWADRAPSLEPIWDEVMRTLRMGLLVTDPTAGPVLQ